MRVILLKIMAKAGQKNMETVDKKNTVVTEKKTGTVIEIVTVIVIETGIGIGKKVEGEREVGLGIVVMIDIIETEAPETKALEAVETIEAVGMIIRLKVGGENHLYFGTYLRPDLNMLHHYNIRPCRPPGKYLLL